MRSDTIWSAAERLAFGGFDLADKLPSRHLRFAAMLLMGPIGIVVTLPLSCALIIIATLVEAWEATESPPR